MSGFPEFSGVKAQRLPCCSGRNNSRPNVENRNTAREVPLRGELALSLYESSFLIEPGLQTLHSAR